MGRLGATIAGALCLWGCAGIQTSATKRYTRASPSRLLPHAQGYVLVGSRYHHKAEPLGEVVFEPLDAQGRRRQAPTVVLTAPESVGLIEVEPVPAGYVVAHTPGPVGNRSVRTCVVHESFGELAAGQQHDVVTGPGNPFFLSLARGDQTLLLMHSGSDHDPGLFMSKLTFEGRPMAWSGWVPDTDEKSRAVDLLPAGDGFVALWRQDSHDERHAVVDTFAADAEHFWRQRFVVGGNLEAARTRDGGVDLVFHDSTGGVDGDLMGLRLAQFPAGAQIALGPQHEKQPHFGTAAWSGARLGIAFETNHGSHLWFATDASDPILLSSSYEGSVSLHADTHRFYLAWSESDEALGVAVLDQDAEIVVAPTLTF